MNDTISVTSSHDSASTIETMAPPLPNRRPRVREVSSRFLSPSLSSSLSSIPKPSHKSDETPNRKTLDTPLTSHNHKFTKKQQPQHPNKENKNSKPRTDTPIDRIVPSRFRQNPNTITNTNKPFNRLPPVTTAAAKLLQSNGLSLSSSADFETSSLEGDEESKSLVGENSPVLTRNRTVRVVSDVTRTSMPEEEIMCNRERSCFSNASFSKMISGSTCSRSLNLGQMSQMSSGGENTRLPPHPTCIKLGGVHGKKGGNKVLCHQEDVHSLKLLYNHHLQWRYANAKAEATIRAQMVEKEKKLYSFGVQVSDLRDVVKRKRMELLLLQQTKTLHTIFESHMPYLDEWSTLEEEYTTSLSGVTHALLNSLLRLPVGADVQADTIEVGEALNSAIKMMEMIGVHVQSFMPKAEEMDNLISELARVIGGEKALIEECGDLLFKTCTSQVEDCSLRGHIMQLHRSNDYQMPNE